MSRMFFGTTFAVLVIFSGGTLIQAKEPVIYDTIARLPGEAVDDRPTGNAGRIASVPLQSAGRCTLDFGYVDEAGFAVPGEMWTFDHGGPDPLEGWTEFDRNAQTGTYFRHVSATVWQEGDAENGNVPTENFVEPPILSGLGSIWLGAFQNEANDFCWEGGLGYGNIWCQVFEGPILDHDGDAVVSIDFDYFNDTEPDFDFTRLFIRTLPSGIETELLSQDGQIGLATDHPNSPPVGTAFSVDFDAFGSDTQFQLVFKMTSDGGWSDEDGEYTTEYGAFGVDNIVIGNTGATGDVTESYDFEVGLDGWLAIACPGEAPQLGVADIASYPVGDLCGCDLVGNVLEFHDDNREHPYGQRTRAQTPPVDLLAQSPICSGTGRLEIFADWTQYTELPRANGVFYRPSWIYFPYLCSVTGEEQWSTQVVPATFFSTGDNPVCHDSRSIATDVGVPPDVEQIRFNYTVYASCDAFSIAPEECTNVTNFSPLVDNVRIRVTNVPAAPPIAFNPGGQFQDGFSQSQFLDPNEPGNANVVYLRNGHSGEDLVLGDSLFVVGSTPTAGFEYDTRLWFRVARRGPGSNTVGYDNWRARVQQSGGIDAVDGVTDIEAGEFATAKMDSFQIGVNPSSATFHSYFIEEDARFDVPSGEISTENEIIADGVLLPGTKVDYFITANYLSTPNEFYLLPDTLGGYFYEFEILPSYRESEGVLKFPCLLYVDAFNGGAQEHIENALGSIGVDHDRYDYLDPCSCWNGPMIRGTGPNANNGATLWQLLGYRTILVNTGSSGALNDYDYVGLSDWLTSIDGSGERRGLILNGDNISGALHFHGAALLNADLGATHVHSIYREFAEDGHSCVRLEAPTAGGEAYGTATSSADYSYGASGNGCDVENKFDVLGVVGSGVGNRAYVNAQSGEETVYAQVVNESGSGAYNYRTVIDGVSWHHLSELGSEEECVGDSAHVVTAIANELTAALEWVYGVGAIPALCDGEFEIDLTSVPGGGDASGAGTRLFQNTPNPFNPHTTLRFALAVSGPVQLAIYDVNGRRVMTLVDAELESGSHEVVWDGTNDAGVSLGAGVYWSQFEANGLKSNKKMVMLHR